MTSKQQAIGLGVMSVDAGDVVWPTRELRSLIHSKAAEGDANCQVSKDVVDAIREAQLFGSIAPKRWVRLGCR